MQSDCIKLIKVKKQDYKFLYELLKKRDPRTNISHRKMPTYKEHEKFVASKPYKAWYVIYTNNIKTGSIYLSKQNEIGIFLSKKYQGKSIGQEALRLLMEMIPQKRYLANVSPQNTNSAKFFKKNKFRLIQHTYEYTPSENQ
ncbi:MAG: GNAT family N-acetyltransferase [Nitrosopumilaceae archaeon]|nr:GNAT family N-acetyltransferase [Nitrosopumilaceae archaeon]NDB63251.1 GNAT family N-acetyltransferase [Nitrosopumilaceae archaeon]NDB88979.1 GNAT family N-acetyltransferase [Nitrososphaerota archaeon]NDF25539.1 GNAT family N-acetyltransferase [Nitrososphaerota archaeon]NDF35933.1 GNAT family N-acetyltransferase [Nitrosopumilaceae archaeon]